MISIIQITAVVISIPCALLSIFFFYKLNWPAPISWILKLYTSAVSPIILLIAVLSTVTGLVTGYVLLSILGIYNMVIYANHIFRITRPPDPGSGFENAFGTHWQRFIGARQQERFLPGRASLKLPSVPKPRLEQNISFATVPGTGRQLLCDIWQPPQTIPLSGVAFIYFHGSAWYLLDKDVGTRPFFRHLAAQGHVIMDVAYRLAPETDMKGMIDDVKRAIVWMKENAARFGVDPNRIVSGGASAGAHLAMLAAYTLGNPLFEVEELKGKDAGVCAVISMYGPTDLEPMFYYINQHRLEKPVAGKIPPWMIKVIGKDFYRLGMDKIFINPVTFVPLLGGRPDECRTTYELFSPVRHVHPGCPPTLIVHGEQDAISPVSGSRNLYKLLRENKVPSVLHIIPQTDHAFDLQLPRLSQSAHNAIYDVERFLALQVKMNEESLVT